MFFIEVENMCLNIPLRFAKGIKFGAKIVYILCPFLKKKKELVCLTLELCY